MVMGRFGGRPDIRMLRRSSISGSTGETMNFAGGASLAAATPISKNVAKPLKYLIELSTAYQRTLSSIDDHAAKKVNNSITSQPPNRTGCDNYAHLSRQSLASWQLVENTFWFKMVVFDGVVSR